jgi:hypothetical protein
MHAHSFQPSITSSRYHCSPLTVAHSSAVSRSNPQLTLSRPIRVILITSNLQEGLVWVTGDPGTLLCSPAPGWDR